MTQRRVGEGERAQFSGVYIEDRDGVGRLATHVEQVGSILEEETHRTLQRDVDEGVSRVVVPSHLVSIFTGDVQIAFLSWLAYLLEETCFCGRITLRVKSYASYTVR